MGTSFGSHIREQVRRFGHSRWYTYLTEGVDGPTEHRLTYTEIDSAARAVAYALRHRIDHGADPETPALLLFQAGPGFLTAYLGCLYAGIPAVPVPIPTDARSTAQVTAIVADTALPLALTSDDLHGAMRKQLPATVELMAVDRTPPAPACWAPEEVSADTLATLQYTSGSTSEPRGVMVTQGNLWHNSNDIQTIGRSGPDLVGGVWLPHFHDMGLLSLLHALHVGGSCVVMAPMTFLRRPVRWLQAISRWQVTMTAAPDFAYELCSRVVTADQVKKLDLSSLRSAMTGAEPVRASTLRRFVERFTAAGLRPDVFSPCYGLAENTLVATSVRTGEPAAVLRADPVELAEGVLTPTRTDGVELVGCGTPVTADVRIVDPVTGVEVGPGGVGEIWLGGPSVARGYWNRPADTARTFQAYTAAGAGPFLRTGDLAAWQNGHLYVTGRIKDLIIVRGRNLYPQDVEAVVRETHPALAPGHGVVFDLGSAHDMATGGERVVVLHEVWPALLSDVSLTELARLVQQDTARRFDMPTPTVVFTPRGAVSRTTSGKVQRARTRDRFLAGRIRILHQELPVVPRAALNNGQVVRAV